MAIAPAKWMGDAVPSVKGWHHRRTGELLKSMKISQAAVDEWNAENGGKELEPVKAEEPAKTTTTRKYTRRKSTSSE